MTPDDSLINRTACKKLALQWAREVRKGWAPGRVSNSFLDDLETELHTIIQKAVERHPCCGRAIRSIPKEAESKESSESVDRVLYSSGDMARRCGVSRKTWCEWIRQGNAPGPVMVGNARKWIARDIDDWMERLKKRAVDRIFEEGDNW